MARSRQAPSSSALPLPDADEAVADSVAEAVVEAGDDLAVVDGVPVVPDVAARPSPPRASDAKGKPFLVVPGSWVGGEVCRGVTPGLLDAIMPAQSSSDAACETDKRWMLAD